MEKGIKLSMLTVKNLTKEYIDYAGYKKTIFTDISFDIDEKKVNTVIAPVGSGKSTLLRIIAGLIKFDSGEINKQKDSKIVFIPSKPSSFPWFNVEENIKLFAEDKSDKAVLNFIEKVGLEGYEKHYPHNKSIGFRYRIALARALAAGGNIILLDEPFNDISADYKYDIYNLTRQVVKELNITILLATTDITEAIFLSDKIILFKKNAKGRLTELAVNFPEKRTEDILTNETAEKIKNEVERYFKQNLSRQFFKITF
ncbi:ATP-binding cassette domain-containing protein [Melioribacteraceae bacterium 4301-Me]|uniref:ATP-binding cassette domain-containing protein n=1 Tax=Pyranulibacter aquaticus TaxID=3163344 RepID=UPI003598125C